MGGRVVGSGLETSGRFLGLTLIRRDLQHTCTQHT